MLQPVYPNPANSLISIPVYSERNAMVRIDIFDATGRKVDQVFNGEISGDQRISHFVDAYEPGSYFVVAEGDFGRQVSKLQVIR
jgi:hypothetical protein